MDKVYFGCAIVGGTLLVCQFVMTLLGLGHHDIGGDHDVGHDAGHGHDATGDHGDSHDDHGSSWFVGILSFRTLVAAVTFFGLAGKFGQASELQPGATLTLALLAAAGSMFIVAWLMRSLYRLRSDGTVRIERAVGAPGTVYLTVPGSKSGVGKVTLRIQDRTMEYNAVTSESDPIPTGTEVVAVAIAGPGTVEISPVPSAERVAHV